MVICFVEKLRKLILASMCIQVLFDQKNHKLWGTQKILHPLTGLESDHGFMDPLISFYSTYKILELLTQYLKKRLFTTAQMSLFSPRGHQHPQGQRLQSRPG